ncbi:YheC/YheD family protein [Paenibacillus sp. CN-4]|uniref:YheC/YheD family protein n=1 Tax=Paenibacillus nanchangensis TaxID=3348343 RepID=UPI003978FDFC
MQRTFVGILLNASVYRGLPKGNTGQEYLPNYEKAAAAYGLTPCYLQLEGLEAVPGYSKAYIRDGRGYTQTFIPTPQAVHNRAIYVPSVRRPEQLARSGLLLFNLRNRYGKDVIHRLLAEDPGLAPHLPDSAWTPSGVRALMERCDDLILKPCFGSVGHGLIRLRKREGRWFGVSSRSGTPFPFRPPHGQDGSFVRNGIRYLAQARVPLASAPGGRPFDLRLTVQRGWGGEWRVTGHFAKLAPPSGFVTNIARGGAAVKVEEALASAFPGRQAAEVRMHAEELGLEVARTLSRRLPGLADLGLDLAAASDGRLYFIECNGRDQRYGLLRAGLRTQWEESYRRPMAYARYLLENGAGL